MIIIDSVSDKVRGILITSKYDLAGNLVDQVTEENVILNQSNQISRDVMLGISSARIASLGVGDLGLTEDDDIVNVPPAQSSDTGLVRSVGSVTAVGASIEYEGFPAIQYTAVLDYNQVNGSGRQLITEYCLLTGDGRAFNKKNRSAIIKTSEFRYTFTWIIQYL